MFKDMLASTHYNKSQIVIKADKEKGSIQKYSQESK
jgi:hypothetical protein